MEPELAIASSILNCNCCLISICLPQNHSTIDCRNDELCIRLFLNEMQNWAMARRNIHGSLSLLRNSLSSVLKRIQYLLLHFRQVNQRAVSDLARYFDLKTHITYKHTRSWESRSLGIADTDQCLTVSTFSPATFFSSHSYINFTNAVFPCTETYPVWSSRQTIEPLLLWCTLTGTAVKQISVVIWSLIVWPERRRVFRPSGRSATKFLNASFVREPMLTYTWAEEFKHFFISTLEKSILRRAERDSDALPLTAVLDTTEFGEIFRMLASGSVLLCFAPCMLKAGWWTVIDDAKWVVEVVRYALEVSRRRSGNNYIYNEYTMNRKYGRIFVA